MTLAVGTLLRMIQEYSEKQIVWVLTLIPEAYEDKPGMLRANLIRVLGQLIKANPNAGVVLGWGRPMRPPPPEGTTWPITSRRSTQPS